MASNKARKVQNVATIIESTLNALGLTRVPENKDMGSVGTYKTWSAEQKRYNEETVKPFRVTIARTTYDEIFTLIARYGVTPEDVMALDALIHDGLKYFEKCPEVFKAHVKATPASKPAQITNADIIAALVKNGMTVEEATALLTGKA